MVCYRCELLQHTHTQKTEPKFLWPISALQPVGNHFQESRPFFVAWVGMSTKNFRLGNASPSRPVPSPRTLVRLGFVASPFSSRESIRDDVPSIIVFHLSNLSLIAATSCPCSYALYSKINRSCKKKCLHCPHDMFFFLLQVNIKGASSLYQKSSHPPLWFLRQRLSSLTR